MARSFTLDYEVDKIRSPGYKRTIQVVCDLDPTKPSGLHIKEVKELTLFGLQENCALLEDMNRRPLVWTETFATLRKRLLST